MTASTSRDRSRVEDSFEFKLMFVLTFTVFLVAATVGRLLPEGWRPLRRGPGSHRSIVGEARAAAGTCVPFVFMG